MLENFSHRSEVIDSRERDRYKDSRIYDILHSKRFGELSRELRTPTAYLRTGNHEIDQANAEQIKSDQAYVAKRRRDFKESDPYTGRSKQEIKETNEVARISEVLITKIINECLLFADNKSHLGKDLPAPHLYRSKAKLATEYDDIAHHTDVICLPGETAPSPDRVIAFGLDVTLHDGQDSQLPFEHKNHALKNITENTPLPDVYCDLVEGYDHAFNVPGFTIALDKDDVVQLAVFHFLNRQNDPALKEFQQKTFQECQEKFNRVVLLELIVQASVLSDIAYHVADNKELPEGEDNHAMKTGDKYAQAQTFFSLAATKTALSTGHARHEMSRWITETPVVTNAQNLIKYYLEVLYKNIPDIKTDFNNYKSELQNGGEHDVVYDFYLALEEYAYKDPQKQTQETSKKSTQQKVTATRTSQT